MSENLPTIMAGTGGPEFLTAGIWKRGFIKFINNCEIEDLFIKQNSVTEKRADLSAIFEIDAPLAQKVVLKLKYGEQKIEKEIELAEGINKINYDFSITNPDLWWCNGLGKPDLYTFRAEVHVDQEVVAEKEVITGLRSVKVVQKRDGKGSSFYIELNGKPVFMKGANYIPQEMFLNRVKERDYRKLIADSVAANMNMLRVWGGGIYEKNIFYELCDRNGILVWQDFMFACALYPGNTDYLENVKKEAADNIKRLRNHPSIALWCGNNENYIGWRDWGWKKRYSEEDRKKIEADYSRLFDKLLPELVKEYDPGKFYWPSSPLHGWDYPVNSEGDVHNWGVWHGQYPFDYFEKEENIGRFMSEYGFQGAPSPETVKSFTLPKDRDLNSEVMKAHQKHRIGYPVIDKYMLWYYNKPKDFDSWLHVSQLLQGYGIRVGIEAHRRAMPFCMGTLYWQLNDCWPVTSWSGIDSRGEWKALHYKVREAYREILISPVIKGDDLKVFMVSDYYETVKGVLEIEAMDFTGDVKYRTKSAVSLKRNSSVAVITEKIENICGKTGKDGIVVAYRFTSQKGETVNTLRCLVPPKDLRLKNPEIEVETAKDPDGIVIKLKSATFAKGVRLSAETCNVFFSNNYFDLLPGIEFIVKAETGTDIDKLKKNLKIVSLYDTYN